MERIKGDSFIEGTSPVRMSSTSYYHNRKNSDNFNNVQDLSSTFNLDTNPGLNLNKSLITNTKSSTIKFDRISQRNSLISKEDNKTPDFTRREDDFRHYASNTYGKLSSIKCQLNLINTEFKITNEKKTEELLNKKNEGKLAKVNDSNSASKQIFNKKKNDVSDNCNKDKTEGEREQA